MNGPKRKNVFSRISKRDIFNKFQLVKTINAGAPIISLDVFPDSKIVTGGEDNLVKIWDLSSGKFIRGINNTLEDVLTYDIIHNSIYFFDLEDGFRLNYKPTFLVTTSLTSVIIASSHSLT